MQELAIERIEAQQKGREGSAVWMVGEQLKDICRNEPQSAELLARDMEVPALSLVEAEKQIKAYADKHKNGTFACVTPLVAEGILREFYGLPGRDAQEATQPPAGGRERGKLIDIMDFMG